MRTTHLRQADLNLLVVFTAVAEERNITRAASRLLLSQPAVTRALQRLRDTFHDDLLIRTSSGYEPTPAGHRLLQDLATMLPRLDRLMAGGDFDPATEDVSFRIAATDHAAHLLVPPLYTFALPKRTKVEFSFLPLHAGQYEALEKGRLDLVLSDSDTATVHLSKEVIFEVDFVCVVSRKSKFTRAITLKQYLAAEHVAVDIVGGVQTHPDRHLAAIGEKRHCPLVVAQHTVAMRVAAVTEMIATVPRRMAVLEASNNKATKILEAPAALGSFKYVMIWHPRMQTDAAHVWLRSIIRELGKQLS
jgi:DNA-binding transcriptional LysR family regulator